MIKKRYKLIEKYPFCKYKNNVPFYPTNKEIEEIELNNRYFKDITIEYKILEIADSKIIKVMNLRDKRTFEINDKVWYKLPWIKNKIKFTITQFSIDGTFRYRKNVWFNINKQNMKHKGLIINIILFLLMSFCMVKSVYRYKIVDCGKVVGKSQDEVTIKYSTQTKLYLLVNFEKTGFKAQLVNPTTYFQYNKNDIV